MELSRESAKQLKDAGFPQEGTGKRIPDYELGGAEKDQWVKVPTLSELIEACGDELAGIGRPTAKRNFWEAVTIGFGPIRTGATPEEAVKEVWLALNKK